MHPWHGVPTAHLHDPVRKQRILTSEAAHCSVGRPRMTFRFTLLLLVLFGTGHAALGGFVFSTPGHSDISQLPLDLSHKGHDMGERLQIVSCSELM